MSRGGRTKNRENESERQCVVSGISYAKSELVRFCANPDGIITSDIYAKLPGRGFWVRANHETLEKFIKRPELAARALKRNVTMPRNLLSDIESLLTARVLSLISMARKAGLAIIGFENTQKNLENGKAVVVFQASDGSARTKAKLKIYDRDVQKITCLTGSEIGLAFGRKNVIHSALLSGGLTKPIIGETTRLAGVRKVGKGA